MTEAGATVGGTSTSTSTPISIPPRLWSYALLKDGVDVLVPVDADGNVELDRIGPLAIRHYSPEHGLGFIRKRSPTEQDIARWLFGINVIAPGWSDRQPHRAAKAHRVFQSFVMADELPRQARAEVPSKGAEAVRQRKLRDREVRRHRARLQIALRTGLQRRLDTLLEGQEDMWLAFAARGYKVPGLRVCEQCSLVFKGRTTTRRCPACNRSPVAPKVRPVAEGGWHLDMRVGGYWSTGEFERTITYTALCQHCTRQFTTTDPRGRHCENCRSDSGRQRRHRQSRSSTGRTTFSYISAEGGPLLSAGVTGPDGQGLQLEAVDGVVHTTDLEYARQLDANPVLRRIDGSHG